MKKIVIPWVGLAFIFCAVTVAAAKDLEIQGERLLSKKPPFTLIMPSALRLIHDYSHENPKENSLTRVYFLLRENKKQVEEMLIVQIADKTNPQAGPMTVPPLRPYTEKRMYSKDTLKKGEVEIDYLIQLMAWNPDAPSLQLIGKQGIVIPPHWALQGQFLFVYPWEHAVLIRYSKDANAFGMRVSREGGRWGREVISGNEKKAYEVFKKNFMEMMGSIQIKTP